MCALRMDLDACGWGSLCMSVGDGEVYEWVWPKGIGEVRSGEGKTWKKSKGETYEEYLA